METRKMVLFKVNGEVVVEEPNDLTDEQIEAMKWIVAEEIEVAIFEVEAERIEIPFDLSDIDVTTDGLLDWKDSYFTPIVGIKLSIEIGSDEYLDAILNGTLDTHLDFLK